MKSPWYPRYPQDITGSVDCRMMSLEQFGLYNWLLDYSWNNEARPCHLEYDVKKLAQLVGVSLAKFASIWIGVQKKFKFVIDPDTKREWIYNERLLSEYHKRIAQAERQEDRAKKAAQARWNMHAPSITPSIPVAMQKQSLSDSPLQSQSQSEEKEEKHIANSSRYAPDFEDFWRASSMRGSKFEASKVWEKLTKTERPQAREAMEFNVRNIYPGQEERFVPHVVKWLKGRRWEVAERIPSRPRGEAIPAFDRPVVLPPTPEEEAAFKQFIGEA